MPWINKPIKKNNINISDNRKERQKIYQTSNWKKLRLAQITNHPLCQICLDKGIIKAAVDVHHIISFMTTNDLLKRNELAFNPDNLLSLCKECHQMIHNTPESH